MAEQGPKIELTIQGGAAPVGEIIPYSELTPVQEILTDGLAGVQIANGLVRLMFYVERAQAAGIGAPIRPLVARLAMTPTATVAVSAALSQVISQLTESGVFTSVPEVTTKP